MHLQQYIVFISLSLPASLSSVQTCDDQYQYKMNGRCCDKCPPGQYMTNRCKSTEPTECVPCPDETFTKHYNNHLNCQPCQSCTMTNLLYQSQCSRTSNAVCKCEPGLQCTGNSCQGCEMIQNTNAPEHPTPNAAFNQSVVMAVNPNGHDLLHIIADGATTKHSKEGDKMLLVLGLIALCLVLAALILRKTLLLWIKSKHGVWTLWKPCTVYLSTEVEEVPMPIQEESGKSALPLDV